MKDFYLMTVLATNKLENTKLVQGFMALLADATKVLIGLTGGITAFIIIVNLLRMKAAEQEEKPKFRKNAWTAGITGVVILVIEGTLAAVFSYFQ